jgi:hypothetical protein
MTAAELKSIRTTLGLSVAWCHKHAGRVTDRSWRYWEDGTWPVPAHVEARMVALSKVIPVALALDGTTAHKPAASQ